MRSISYDPHKESLSCHHHIMVTRCLCVSSGEFDSILGEILCPIIIIGDVKDLLTLIYSSFIELANLVANLQLGYEVNLITRARVQGRFHCQTCC